MVGRRGVWGPPSVLVTAWWCPAFHASPAPFPGEVGDRVRGARAPVYVVG